MFDNNSIAVMYAVSPCHAGSGNSLGVIDNPIQRERHTNWPMIQSSGVKGAFRANFDRYKDRLKEKAVIKSFDKLTDSIFGCEKIDSETSGFAGSACFSDAKILAYPMRSNVYPFVWITCPAVLKRLERDLVFAGLIEETKKTGSFEIPEIENEGEAFIINGKGLKAGKVLLEDYEVEVDAKEITFELFNEYFKDAERLLLVSDTVFNYGVSDCTQIMAQIKIDSKTGTTKDGSLRYQEELPSDTIMYVVVNWGDSFNSAETDLKAETIKKYITEDVIKNFIQVAGDETCGRGIFQLTWLPKKENN